MEMISGVCTLEGKHGLNEDAHVIDEALGLFVVADGMGGYEGGEVASRLVACAIHEVVADRLSPSSDLRGGLLEDVLGDALRVANRQVHQRRRGRLACMGSTASALLLRGTVAAVGHVGDSRVYRVRDRMVQRLTADHTVGAALVAAGRRGDHMGHVLTRAMGVFPNVARDLRLDRLLPGDVFVLCTDGLSDMVAAPEIGRVASALSPGDAACRLASMAHAAGATDDISTIVVRVERRRRP